MSIELSVVIPVYCCARCLDRLHERLVAVLAPLTPDFEIIMVNDASPDEAWPVMCGLAERDPRVRAVALSRNFGQHAAMTAGLAEARGRYAVVMDCDLQDPPEELPRLYAKAQEGYDVVYAKRKRKQHSLYRQTMARVYNKVLNLFSPHRIDPEYGSFSLIARPVIDAYLGIRNHGQHYLFMLHWLGFRSTHIEYEHAERGDQGPSSYTLGHLIRFALDGLFLQTTVLLRWIVYFGFGCAGLGFLGVVWMTYKALTGPLLPGWASLGVLILMVGGVLMISLGIVALYIGRIFEQVQERPHYVVAQRVGGGREAT
ncbi:MAG: glycosyltransferase [Cyanobacteria bacterium RYN_339]|nr:glycosyltransferase [Cyanobacteria bacterium RYN_339]